MGVFVSALVSARSSPHRPEPSGYAVVVSMASRCRCALFISVQILVCLQRRTGLPPLMSVWAGVVSGYSFVNMVFPRFGGEGMRGHVFVELGLSF